MTRISLASRSVPRLLPILALLCLVIVGCGGGGGEVGVSRNRPIQLYVTKAANRRYRRDRPFNQEFCSHLANICGSFNQGGQNGN